MNYYTCAVCMKREKVSDSTGKSDVVPQEIWLRRPIYMPERRWGGLMRDFPHEFVHDMDESRSMIMAHKECAETWETIIKLRKLLSERKPWQAKQQELCRLLTDLTDFNNLLPEAGTVDWRPSEMIPEDYYNR